MEAVILMFCEDLKRRLMGEGVSKVFRSLKVSNLYLSVCLSALYVYVVQL